MTTREDNTDFEEDPRYAIANREALWGVGYWLVFTVVISAIAWLLGGNVDADELDFILGFPAWFFWSCLVATTVLSLLPIWIVRHYFTEMSLTADGDDTGSRSE
ncbi:MAG: YhdT family protein [Actinomycetia bacterium]|nr:YhdT family protein [Actinomycetes bacterium]